MSAIIVGIIPVGGELTLRDQYPLVHATAHYNIVDVYTVATVVQDYVSNASINRDTEYVFPLPPSAAVCSFKAVIDDKKTIKGIVKEKREAKREFDQAVAQGYTAGLLQQEHSDVFRVSLGNIRPKQKISVHISFVSIIPHDGSAPQTLRITMPTAIAPRYGAPPTGLPWFGVGKNTGNRFELSVAVQMSKPVTSISSPSHPIGLTLGCAQKELQGDFEPSKAFVYLGDSTFLDKDIVILISAQGLDTPRCTVERWLPSEGAEEITDAYALTLVPKFDLPALPRQEYIFLVDRSGSMGTGRMNAVKASLQIMLRSLPSRNTTFNIVSFGSRYSSLWNTPQSYSAESVEEASRHVDSLASNYGGTELRSALEYAFGSRAAARQAATEEKIPASVFVLTDGEAWDLRGVLDVVANNVEKAKKENSLLRTFVLGVGNQVSTAMCEGIARAGRGTAVFVAEGEKPDSKLMGLLKAARGGVIEDLAVDWNLNPESNNEEDDDFEVIDEPKAATPPPPAAPISLFDDTPMADATEIGPEKAVANLSPPPKIQQAPKSDKLPIPLYPGFRCSIFAIIKQPQNPGPHPPNVKITGKVLGRDVVLQLPVTPISIATEATKDVVENNKLLHTLAAKALIQVWEDLPPTPETKAQIERLGKRYSLASSVTSFLAIDKENDEELHSSPPPQQASPPSLSVNIAAMPTGAAYGMAMPMLAAASAPVPPPPPPGAAGWVLRPASSGSRPSPPPPPRAPAAAAAAASFGDGYQAASYSAPPPRPQQQQQKQQLYGYAQASPQSFGSTAFAAKPLSFAPQPMSPPDIGFGGASPVMSTLSESSPVGGIVRQRQNLFVSAAAPPPSAPQSVAASSQPTGGYSSSFQHERERERSSVADVIERGERLDSLQAKTESLAFSAHLFERKKLKKQKAGGSPGFSASTGPTGPPSAGPPSVETFARSQNFDGSFPPSYIASIAGANPPVPSVLAGLGQNASIDSIWATVLALAYLEKKFAGERDAWEILADKAKDYVDGALQDLGVDAGSTQGMLTELMKAALASF